MILVDGGSCEIPKLRSSSYYDFENSVVIHPVQCGVDIGIVYTEKFLDINFVFYVPNIFCIDVVATLQG